MRKSAPAANPAAYLAALTGWRWDCVTTLRDTVKAAVKLNQDLGDPTDIR
jgi:hypothetical protein